MNKKTKYTTLFALALAAALVISAIPNLNITTVNAADDYGDPLQYEWMQPGTNSGLNYRSYGPAPSTPNVLWKRQIPGVSFGSQSGDLVAFNGMVFARNGSGILALDRLTGALVYFIFIPAGSPFGGGGGGRIVKLNDSVMVIGADGYSIANGEKLWDGDQSSSALYIREEQMFVDLSTGGGRAWDASNPYEKPVEMWDLRNEFEMEYFDCYGEGLIFTKRYTTIHAVNAKTGATVWQTPTTNYKAYSMSYYEGRLYSGQLNGEFVCWNATTGEHIWTYDAGSGFAFWAGRIAAYEGKLYSMNQDTNMYCFDAATGEVLWTYAGPGVYYQGHAIVGDGKVYAQTGDVEYRDPDTGERGHDEYACLNATTGEVLWTLPTGVNAPNGPHCLAYGNLYFIPATTKEQYRAGVFSRAAIGDVLYCISGEPRDYTQWRGDPAHNADGDHGPTKLALKWTYQTEGAVSSSPAVADGIVYVGSHDTNLYALDAETGEKEWSFQTGYRVHSSPAVVNGKVYTGTDDGNVYCLDAKTGNTIWINSEPEYVEWVNWGALQSFNIRSSPAVVNDKVYVGSLDKNLYCIDAYTGVTLWKFESGGYIHSSPAVADGAVYVATATGRPAGRLYKLDADTGSVIWMKMLFYQRGPGPLVPWSSPTVAEGMVFQSIDGFDHYGINATDGSTVWKYRSISWQVIGASPLYVDGRVYIVDLFTLIAVDAKTGATNYTDPNVLWGQFLAREIYSSPTSAFGKVYAASEQMALYVLDAKTGEKLSYYELGTQLLSSPVPYDGKLYIGGINWNVYCFEDPPQAPPTVTGAIEPIAEPTLAPETTPAPTPEPPVAPNPEPDGLAASIDAYLIVAAVAAIAVILVAAIFLRKRKD